MLDGWLARGLGVNGAFGARLDSASDFLLIVVLLVRLWPVITPSRPIAAWVAGIALARLAAAWTAKCRFGKFGFLHTRLNKLTGVALAVYPFALLWRPLWRSTVALCALASVSALEELAIEWTAEVWDADRKSMF